MENSHRIPRRLLVRGVNWLGDAVITTPALLRLRQALPETSITLLTHEKLADLWGHHPAIDQVLTFRRDESVWSIGRRLRREELDTALLLPNSPRSALESWLAGIPRRIGGAWPWRNGLLTDVVPPDAQAPRMRKRTETEIETRVAAGLPREIYPSTAHQLHHYLKLASVLGASLEPVAPRMEITAGEVTSARERFGLASNVRWLGLNPGAEYGPAKRWPADRFAAVACEGVKRAGWGVVLFGGGADVAAAREIEEAARAGSKAGAAATELVNLAGRTSLRELAAALKCCAVVVTNDTGPMHLAAAVGTRVVALFGSTSPELTGPGLPADPGHQLLTANVPCAPCFRRECPLDLRCLTGLSVARVIDEVFSAPAAGG